MKRATVASKTRIVEGPDGLACRSAGEHARLVNDCSVTVTAPAPVIGNWDLARLDPLIANLMTHTTSEGISP